MKTAIIMTGQARSFATTFRTQNWNFYRNLPDPHFFVSINDDADADAMKVIGEKYPLKMEKVQDKILPEPKDGAQLASFAGYGFGGTIQRVLQQHYALKRGWEYFREQPDHDTFDLIVRLRPDLWVQDFVPPDYSKIGLFDCHTPWYSSFGGVNDRFAIMGYMAAKAYMTVYDKHQALWDAGCPLHHETMVRAAMEMDGVRVKQDLLAEYRICRKTKPGEPVQIVPEQMWPHDWARMMALTSGIPAWKTQE